MQIAQPDRSSERGMTIVEVLMVVFIIGLAAGIVTMTIPQRPTTEQATAQAFGRLITEAQDQAILSGQPIGLFVTDKAYGLVQWRRGQWRAYTRPASLPRQIEITEEDAQQTAPEGWPDLVFDPTGIVQPTEFNLRGRGVRIDISLLETGEVQFETR